MFTSSVLQGTARLLGKLTRQWNSWPWARQWGRTTTFNMAETSMLNEADISKDLIHWVDEQYSVGTLLGVWSLTHQIHIHKLVLAQDLPFWNIHQGRNIWEGVPGYLQTHKADCGHQVQCCSVCFDVQKGVRGLQSAAESPAP